MNSAERVLAPENEEVQATEAYAVHVVWRIHQTFRLVLLFGEVALGGALPFGR